MDSSMTLETNQNYIIPVIPTARTPASQVM